MPVPRSAPSSTSSASATSSVSGWVVIWSFSGASIFLKRGTQYFFVRYSHSSAPVDGSDVAYPAAMSPRLRAKIEAPAAMPIACQNSWYPNHVATGRGRRSANSTAPTV